MLEENIEEREYISPLRCWPRGLCLSKSIGDMDLGEFIVPIPYVKQVKLSNTCGRLITASDGIWDTLSLKMTTKSCHALRTRGLKDDTTCIVVDIIPPEVELPQTPPPKKRNKLRDLFFRKRSRDSTGKLSKKLSAINIVEELFEEGSIASSKVLFYVAGWSGKEQDSMIVEDDMTGDDKVTETNILFRDFSFAGGSDYEPDDREVAAVGAVCGILATARQRHGSWAVFTRNRFKIRRDHILEDAYDLMSQLSEDDLRGLIRVTFVNEFGVKEAGIDEGGIFKVFMENITRAAFDVQYGLFKVI
ncbi:hypothetical protein RJT34_02438 [Clitoria ternatea]|uniref:HECT-type E3 ubiquitin transferase n=1 Tax=Clitoria ternatea TaxID=43366 RepID=A0AAN9KI43_CLITE